MFPHFIGILSKKLAKSFLQLPCIFFFYCLHVSFKILTSFWFIFFYQNLPNFCISQLFIVTKNIRKYTFEKYFLTKNQHNAIGFKVKGVSMKLTKETIWHFTCDFCKLWWSFASSDEFQPKKKIFCPHCGKKNEIDDDA